MVTPFENPPESESRYAIETGLCPNCQASVIWDRFETSTTIRREIRCTACEWCATLIRKIPSYR